MERDLQIHTEAVDHLRAELAHVVEYFRGLEYEWCDVLFGFAWTKEADSPDLSWKNVRVPLSDLDAEVQKAEQAGLGTFTGDDVWVSFEDRDLKVQFCHHSGVHLAYPEPDDVTEHFFARWQARGLDPVELEKTPDPPKWRVIRGKVA